jgi:hypothetical protein
MHGWCNKNRRSRSRNIEGIEKDGIGHLKSSSQKI